jgi:hypothetical protein
MKKLLTGAMIAATLVGAVAVPFTSAEAQQWRRPPYHHHHRGGGGGGDAAAAAALGVVGGMILGGALAQSQRPDYYDDDYVVRRAPRRVYEDDYVVRRAPPRRVYYEEDYRPTRRGTRCQTLIKYDMYGKPYEYKDCDP